MLVATVLVILMTIPGLALFYGGLVRSKNVLSVLMQVFIVLLRDLHPVGDLRLFARLHRQCSAALNPFIGGLSKLFLAGVDHQRRLAATFSKETYIPELRLVIFQMTFAAITPALIVGAFAERMKFSAVLLFMVLWFTFAYLPMAHMVWFWAGPDAYTLSADNLDAVKAAVGEAAANDFLAKLAAATDDAAKARCSPTMAPPSTPPTATCSTGAPSTSPAAPSSTSMPASPAWSAPSCSDKRVGYGKEPMAPHNLSLHLHRRLPAAGSAGSASMPARTSKPTA